MHQVNWILFHPRDDQGRLEPIWTENQAENSQKETFLARWVKDGLTKAEAETKWKFFEKDFTFRANLDRETKTPEEYHAKLSAWRAEQAKGQRSFIRV